MSKKIVAAQHGHLLGAFQRVRKLPSGKFQLRQTPLPRIRRNGIHHRLAAFLLEEAVGTAQEICRTHWTFSQRCNEFSWPHREEFNGYERNAEVQSWEEGRGWVLGVGCWGTREWVLGMGVSPFAKNRAGRSLVTASWQVVIPVFPHPASRSPEIRAPRSRAPSSQSPAPLFC